MLGRTAFRAATPDDLGHIGDRLVDAKVFKDEAEAVEHIEAHPWAMQVSDRHPARNYAVLGVWRLGTNMAAIRLLVASPREQRRFLAHLLDVLQGRGFSTVLSPFLQKGATKPFHKTGFTVYERLLTLHKRGLGFRDFERACAIREMTPEDLDDVVSVDRASFDDVWQFRHSDVSALLPKARIFVAVREGRLIGYNMVSVSGEVGAVGRLAVHPDCRNQGVGSTLLAAGLVWLEEAGCTEVTLCTQHDNQASRNLYERFGFEQLPDELSIMKKDL